MNYYQVMAIAMLIWRKAHRRGLVSRREWRAYRKELDTSPVSWKGWLRYEIGRRNV